VLQREITETRGGKSHSSQATYDERVKLLTLARDLRRRKSRERHSLFVAEGVRSVEELLRSGLAIRGVLVAPQLSDAPRGQALRDALTASGLEVTEVDDRDFRSAAETESPQGVLAIGEVPPRTLDTLKIGAGCRLVLLDGVQDPGNVGTIVRTAAALGATATIALPGTVDLWNPKVIRSSMGAQFLHPALHASTEAVLGYLRQNGIALWAADAGGQELPKTTAPSKLAIAVGNEGSGLSPTLRERADRTVSLPIARGVESLNVAVATGIILYELRA
jgi:RNA methyltransferase, TrmH family